MHTLTRPTLGDIGEEQEEIEVVPTHLPEHTPVTTPAPAEPVPA